MASNIENSSDFSSSCCQPERFQVDGEDVDVSGQDIVPIVDKMTFFTCQKCQRVCKSRTGLSVHQKKCLKGPKGASFFENEHSTKTYDTSDKVLPPSQPLALNIGEQVEDVESCVSEVFVVESGSTSTISNISKPIKENTNENESLSDRDHEINWAYEKIVKWKKNLFSLPKGANGKRFILEMTKLIDFWCSNTDKSDTTLKALMILPSLLL